MYINFQISNVQVTKITENGNKNDPTTPIHCDENISDKIIADSERIHIKIHQ